MASPSVTYTFTNGTTADADQVNQNFTDLINSLTDSTKDLAISALTCAGAATLNGHVTLGNGSPDDITFNGSVASNVFPKTDATYSLGTSSLGWSAVYFGGNSQRVGIKASGSTSATYDITLPTAAGTTGEGLINQGSGVLAWKPMAVDTSAKAAAYVITDSDGIRTVLVTTGASDRDITLPTAADNTHRIITVKKVDSGVGIITLKSDAAGETIDGVSGTTGLPIGVQYAWITVQCDGSVWHIIDRDDKWPSYDKNDVTVTLTNATLDTYELNFIPYQDTQNNWFMDMMMEITLTGVDGGFDATITDATIASDFSRYALATVGTENALGTGMWRQSTNRIEFRGATSLFWRVTGVVKLASRPAWATKR